MTSDKPLRIMGIDPGTNRMGYGVLEVKGSSVSCIAMGDIDCLLYTSDAADD